MKVFVACRSPLVAGLVGSVSMLVKPIRIQVDKLATEVLALPAHHRVDDLVVPKTKGEPVGMVENSVPDRGEMGVGLRVAEEDGKLKC